MQRKRGDGPFSLVFIPRGVGMCSLSAAHGKHSLSHVLQHGTATPRAEQSPDRQRPLPHMGWALPSPTSLSPIQSCLGDFNTSRKKPHQKTKEEMTYLIPVDSFENINLNSFENISLVFLGSS